MYSDVLNCDMIDRFPTPSSPTTTTFITSPPPHPAAAAAAECDVTRERTVCHSAYIQDHLTHRITGCQRVHVADHL